MTSSAVAAKHPSSPPSSDAEPDHRLPPSPPLSPKPAAAPTSPYVDRILRVLYLCRAGRLPGDSDWRSYPLPQREFAELESRLGDVRGWFEDKCHFDHADGRFVLRMAGPLHERFLTQVSGAIVEGIASLSKREGLGALEEVVPTGSWTLRLPVPELVNSSQEETQDGDEDVARHCPDATFCHPAQSRLPTVVVEVSYSQQRKDLPKLADDYIVRSEHDIRCVIGLDLPYSNRKKCGGKVDQGEATVSVWRPGMEKDESGEDVGFCRTDVEAVSFRNASKQACDGALELSVADLLPEVTLTELSPEDRNQKLSIPFSDLAAFLSSAETFAEATGRTRPPSAPKKFRRRKRSPSEELSSDREAKYARLEEAELERERLKDKEWNSRSRRRVTEPQGPHTAVVERRRSGRLAGGRSDGPST